MAALNAAGMDAGAATSHPLRAQIRERLTARNIPILPELKQFVERHRSADPAADLAQYISWALSVEAPPDFKPRYATGEMPPDAANLDGFEALMIRFHREAGIDALYAASAPQFDREFARYSGPIRGAVTEVHAYLRAPTSGYMGRRFQVFLDLLGPANQVHTRSYKNDYFMVVTPAVEPQHFDIRHAYLHYLLDPLATKYAANLERLKPVAEIARTAPALDEPFKADLLLLVTESLIKAVEARLARPELRPEMIADALAEGFVFTPYFGEALPVYEKQEQAMRLYFPDMAAAMDVKKEGKRLTGTQFAAAKRARPAPPPLTTPAPLSAGQKALEEAEGLYTARELDASREAYQRVLRSADRDLHARAWYGLARIAALERNPEMAEELFRKTLDTSPDAPTRAWAEIYLGRLAQAANDPGQAAEHFRRALAVEGASEAARKAAEQGLAAAGPGTAAQQ